MVEWKRDFFKKDAVLSQLHQVILRSHKVADHTYKCLIENRHIKDFCEESRHFVLLPGNPDLYIHYDIACWFKEPNGIQMKVESIAVYDDFVEYESSRIKQLSENKESEGLNLN